MLNELVIEATGKINYNNSLEKQEYEKKNYKAFLDKTNRAIGEIEILLDIAEELNYKNYLDKKELYNGLVTSSDKCYKDIVSLCPNSSDINNLESSIVLFRKSLIEIWKDTIGKEVNSVLNSFLALKLLFSDKDLITDLINRLNKAKDLPKSKQMLKAILDDIGYAKSKIEKLNLNPEIELFIIKATNGTAKFSDLNDNIINWIHNNKIEHKLVISFC